jgi:hypothetical protein
MCIKTWSNNLLKKLREIAILLDIVIWIMPGLESISQLLSSIHHYTVDDGGDDDAGYSYVPCSVPA